MRVAWVVGYPVYGGPHNHLKVIAPALRALGVHPIGVVPDGPGEAGDRWRTSGIEVIEVPLHRMRAVRELRPHVEFVSHLPRDTAILAALLRRHRVDLVVQATLVPPHGAIAARVAGLPLVWQIVDSRVPRAVRTASMTLVRRWADLVMFCGEALVADHVGARPLSVPQRVFFPPVDTTNFVPSAERRAESRRRLGIPLDAPVVGQVGNLNPQKGWEYFVRAAAIIHRAHPDARFLLVGAHYDVHQAYLGRIRAEIAASGVPVERFIITGESREVERLLPAMDVKLITSVPRSEGAPTSGLEALSCGVPVVGVRVAAIPEYVTDGVNGYVVAARDHPAIAAAAIRLLDDDELRSRLGSAGRRIAVERYDAALNARSQHEAFVAAIEHHAARPARLALARRIGGGR